MRDKLQQYVELLFAGAANCEDIQQEILLNTLDRYDDLIAEGKVPEAAYRLAIAGIGDINEILGANPPLPPLPASPQKTANTEQEAEKRKKKAIAVGLYILSPIPLFFFCELEKSTLGLCGTLCLVAIATVLMVLSSSHKTDDHKAEEKVLTPSQQKCRIVWLCGTLLYLVLSFATQAWFITWLVFPICGVLIRLSAALKEYKEAVDNET